MSRVSQLRGCVGAAFVILIAGLFVAGCKGPEFAPVPGMSGPSTAAPQQASITPGPASTVETQYDIIHPGDMLRVEFSDLPNQTQPIEQRVRADGTITLIQNQEFKAAGKTRGQLEDEIRKRYVPSFFLNMTVSVNFVRDSQFYYVGGEVKNPGRQVYISRLRVLGAIKSAGDFTDFANRKKVQLTRADGRQFTINCRKALTDPSLDLEVFPGDNINVPRRTNPFSF